MRNLKFCPECGAELAPNASFCDECGFSVQSLAGPAADRQEPVNRQLQTAPPGAVNRQPTVRQAGPLSPPGYGQQMPSGTFASPGGQGAGNKNLIIMISILAVVFLGGGGLYWWLSRGESPDPDPAASLPSAARQNGTAAPAAQSAIPDQEAAADLSRASTYLSEPWLKCTFFVNYPDGMSGVVERVSALVVPTEAVRVSEAETGVERGESFGYGFHYVERADGTYYILDQTPMEIVPLLKNNLTVGQTWSYSDEFGNITWTVMDMGIDLDLGFTSFKNCLVVREDNQAAEFQSVAYYAPGRGLVLSTDPSGTVEYYRMTALTRIEPEQAAETVIRWSPNYETIRDDRTQY